MNTSKKIVLTTALLAALTVWIPRQMALNQARADLARAGAQLAALKERAQIAQAGLASARQDLNTENTDRDHAREAVAKAAASLSRDYPGSKWAQPPANLPNWNPSSPYIWIPKEMLKQFSAPVFSDKGDLGVETADVLGVDAATQRSLNDKLEQLLNQYHALELSNAVRVIDGKTVTVQINAMPVAGAQFKNDFQSALSDALGDQRATLLTQSSLFWLQSAYHDFGSYSNTISVTPRNGMYDININSHTQRMSTESPSLDTEIPSYLLPLFNEALNLP